MNSNQINKAINNKAILFDIFNGIKILKPKDKNFYIKELWEYIGGVFDIYPSNKFKNCYILCNANALKNSIYYTKPFNLDFLNFSKLYIQGNVILMPKKLFGPRNPK